MSITIEVDGIGARKVDTVQGAGDPLLLKQSLQVALAMRESVTIANGVTGQAIPFGSITAAKVLALTASGPITVFVTTAGGTQAVGTPFDGDFLATSSGGLILSATISNASGSAVTANVLVAG